MRYTVLAIDYDGTLAAGGQVRPATLAALAHWRAAGGVVLLVTGRHLPDLQAVFPQLDAECAMVVAENGALLYHPADGRETLVGAAPPAALVEELRARQVEPLYVGQGNVATLKPHEATVRAVLSQQGLDWHIILNKNDVIVMPAGASKASGLRAALEHLGHTPAQTVAIGDAENDLHMFDICGHAVAVANALPHVKERAHRVTRGENGTGVAEAISALLAEAPA